MQQVGADRGNGPMSTGASPVDVVANQGVARSNEYQTTWEALMNANKMQAQQDASNMNLSYGQQQNTAMTSLQRNLEDKLMQIGGSTAAVQSDIAKAQTAAQQNLMGLQYQAQSDAANRTSAQQVAKIRAGGQVGAAQINASSKAATAAAAALKTKDIGQWTTDMDKTFSQVTDPKTGKPINPSSYLSQSIATLYRSLKNPKSVNYLGVVKEPTKAELISAYLAKYGNLPTASYGVEYINKYFGVK
jgi:hypothetical protein